MAEAADELSAEDISDIAAQVRDAGRMWSYPGYLGAPTHVNVTMVDPCVEKGARFLKEVQDKAAGNIVEALLVDVPGIDAQVVKYQASLDNAANVIRQRCAFRINGHVFDVRTETYDDDGSRAEMVKALADAIAKEITKRVVVENPQVFRSKTLVLGR